MYNRSLFIVRFECITNGRGRTLFGCVRGAFIGCAVGRFRE